MPGDMEVREVRGKFRLIDGSTGRPAVGPGGFLDGGGFATRREAERAARKPAPPARGSTGESSSWSGGFRGGKA